MDGMSQSQQPSLASDAATGTANLSRAPSAHGAAASGASWYDNILPRLGVQPYWPAEKEQAIMEPYLYLDAHPGKEVRSQLIHAFNEWLRVPSEKLDVIRKVVRMLHTASLLMDDVEDNSDLRRGIPVAHRIYGVPQTINTANYVYFLVFEEIFHMSSSEDAPALASRNAERLVAEEMINLHRGQGMDLFWRDSLICPTEEEYVEMVTNKTGGLFRIALKLMMAHSPLFASSGPQAAGAASRPPPSLLPLADLIGLLFQIRDDYMNLQSSQYADNKGFAEDLTEGKFSFPIIHSIRSSVGGGATAFAAAASTSSASPGASTPPVVRPAAHAAGTGAVRDARLAVAQSASASASAVPNRQILNVLKQRPTDLATKTYAVSYMRDVTRSFVYTRDVMRRLDTQARAEVTRIREELASSPDAAAAQGAHTGAAGLLKILDALRSGWHDVQDD